MFGSRRQTIRSVPLGKFPSEEASEKKRKGRDDRLGVWLQASHWKGRRVGNPMDQNLLPLGTIAPRGRRHLMVSLSIRWGCASLVPGLYLGHEPLFPQVRLPAPNQATHPTVYRYYTITVSLTLTLTPSNTASPLGVMASHCRHPIPGVRREGGRGAYGRMDSWTPYTCFPDNSLAGLFFSLSNGRPKRHVAYFRLAKWATEICSCAS